MQIDKEALASTWACERFSDYLIGTKFHLESDHKPLVSLLGSKNLRIYHKMKNLTAMHVVQNFVGFTYFTNHKSFFTKRFKQGLSLHIYRYMQKLQSIP